jgi:hypothetical protein
MTLPVITVINKDIKPQIAEARKKITTIITEKGKMGQREDTTIREIIDPEIIGKSLKRIRGLHGLKARRI